MFLFFTFNVIVILTALLDVFALIGLRGIHCYSGLLRFRKLQILLRTFGVAGMNFSGLSW